MPESQSFKPSGPCIVSSIVALHGTLIEALHAAGSLTVDLSDVSSVDASFVQLLVSASKTALLRGKSLTVVSVPDALGASLRSAGIVVAAPSGEMIFQ